MTPNTRNPIPKDTLQELSLIWANVSTLSSVHVTLSASSCTKGCLDNSIQRIISQSCLRGFYTFGGYIILQIKLNSQHTELIWNVSQGLVLQLWEKMSPRLGLARKWLLMPSLVWVLGNYPSLQGNEIRWSVTLPIWRQRDISLHQKIGSWPQRTPAFSVRATEVSMQGNGLP